jgi:eukaryotic-like serine/threonine-protein kinase
MPLSAGARLGHYEILGALGAGGMGEVYRARDTRLDRTVAIKVLGSAVADDPALRDRFDREAHAIAALNHPNICTLHDVGHEGGIDFLVMEHLEGETLAARLTRERGHGLPIDEALRYAIEIADALDKSHRAGIVHRDLKPANVFLVRVPGGAAVTKLLDFGLAKRAVGFQHGLTPPSSQPSERTPQIATALPTTPPALTAAGTILGTLQYMSPEQLEGMDADARSDIFAFGAVLYEMTTGRRAFEASTQASLIAAILERQPVPISTLEPAAPTALSRIIERCLAKDPDNRWQSSADLLFSLRTLAGIAIVPAPPRTSYVYRAGWAAAALILAVAMFAAGSFLQRPAPEPSPEVRFTVAAARMFGVGQPAVSPDGSTVVFSAMADESSPRMLWIRRLGDPDARALPGTENGRAPFWSPDGRKVGFFADNNVMSVDVAAGSARRFALIEDQLPGARTGTWGAGDTVLIGNGGPTIWRVTNVGGDAPARSDPNARLEFPSFLPDGRRFLYASRRPAESGVYLASIDRPATEDRLILPEFTSAVYVDAGWLLLVRDRNLIAVRFDPDRAQVVGNDVRVIAASGTTSGVAAGAFSAARRVVAFSTAEIPMSTLTWFGRDGSIVGTLGEAAPLRQLALSADGRRLAVERRTNTGDFRVWTVDVERGVTSRLTTTSLSESDPVWSLRGDELIMTTTPDLGGSLSFERHNVRTRRMQTLVSPLQPAWSESWSPDGQYLAVVAQRGGLNGLWAVPLSGTGPAIPLVQGPFSKDEPQFSPDGRSVAYASNESGQFEVYVRPFPNDGETIRVSSDGGSQPKWRADGKELFYLSLHGTVMAAPVRSDPFGIGAPTELFDSHVTPDPVLDEYAPSPDGQRFLFIAPIKGRQPPSVTAVVGWVGSSKP